LAPFKKLRNGVLPDALTLASSFRIIGLVLRTSQS